MLISCCFCNVRFCPKKRVLSGVGCISAVLCSQGHAFQMSCLTRAGLASGGEDQWLIMPTELPSIIGPEQSLL